MSLIRGEELEHAVALEMTVYIEHETDYTPLITFLRNMAYIGDQLILRKSYDVFKVMTFVLIGHGERRISLMLGHQHGKLSVLKIAFIRMRNT